MTNGSPEIDSHAAPRGVLRFGTVQAAVERALAAGRDALDHAAWAEAQACFGTALAAGASIEALQGLGAAARWRMDGGRGLDAGPLNAYYVAHVAVEVEDRPLAAAFADGRRL